MANASKLVIVESPTKAKTIRKFLGSDYRVEASMGHVRDLPASADEIPEKVKKEKWARLGVDIENDFDPIYVVPKSKKKVVAELRKALKEADELYVATDEDREGESIGWHLVEVLKPKVPTHRMVFHEITKDAIERALANPREINEQLVHAQEARRLLDRLVGYTVSPLLWKKVKPRLSAGRVQSVAVRILVMRERERIAFVTGSYWGIKAEVGASGASFSAELQHLNGERIATGRDFDESTGKIADDKKVLLLEEERARALSTALQSAGWSVSSVERKESTRRAYPPFTTSTLQQEANRKLGYTAKQTMQIAQRLYENGLITYMRTDSVNLSQEAIKAARGKVTRLYGEQYLSKSARNFATKSKGAQEAHEAIRPAGTEMKTADELKLSGQEKRLYELIWMRTAASQMADAVIANTSVRLEATTEGGDTAEFRASGREVVFPGFMRAYVEGNDDPNAALDDSNNPLPPLKEGDSVSPEALEAQGHETRPPARFTEATLVKELEKEGIGRPSTYASIIDTIQSRGYVSSKGKQLVPTFTAMAVTSLLEQTHQHVVDLEFTAAMEADLDQIGNASDSHAFLSRVYKDDVLKGVTDGQELDPREICTLRFDKLEPIAVRVGKYGPFLEIPEEGAEKPRTVSLPDDLAPADLTRDMVDQLVAQAERADEPLGKDEETGMDIYVLTGRFGPYLQLGSNDEVEGKPKRVSVPKDRDPTTLTLDEARQFLSLPRTLGKHPEDDKVVKAGIGMYGPYVLHNRVYASLKKEDDVLTVELPRAVELLKEKKEKGGRRGAEPIRELGKHPEDEKPIGVYDGRYGPYVKHGRTNATLPKDVAPNEVTLEQAIELIEARKNAPKKKRTTRKKS